MPSPTSDIVAIVERGAALLETEIPRDIAEVIAGRAGGDARAALQILELAHATSRAEDVPLAESHVLDASRKRPLLYDRKGDQHYDFASAFIKSMRGGDADAAVYYLAAMLEAGEDARFIATAHGHPRLRGRRQRRPERAGRRSRGRAGARARRACPRHSSTSPRRRSTSRARRSRTHPPSRSGRRGATCASTETHARPRCCARRATRPARRRAATAKAMSIRTTTRTGSTSRTFRKSSGTPLLSPDRPRGGACG